MNANPQDKSAEGCAILIAIASISIGIGCLLGAAWGFILFGFAFVGILMVKA